MSRYTGADQTVRDDNVVQESHLVSLVVRKKVCSLVILRGVLCHHTTPISALHIAAETSPTQARPFGSYCP